MDVYADLLQAGVQIDHHESDLYAEITEKSSDILSRYEFKANISVFTEQITGRFWYEIPFAYTPYWERKFSCPQ